MIRLDELGAVKMSGELFEALRIEAGRPSFGVDMDEETIPLEAGLLERGISPTKGCYVGQEIIIRILHRGGGRVAKRLARLTFDPSVIAPPAAGTSILDGDRDVGRITSAAISPTQDMRSRLATFIGTWRRKAKTLRVRVGGDDRR